MRINEITSQEIAEHLNDAQCGYSSVQKSLPRLYQEDGRHYEDEQFRIIAWLKEEAKKREIKTVPISKLEIGTVVWFEDGPLTVFEQHANYTSFINDRKKIININTARPHTLYVWDEIYGDKQGPMYGPKEKVLYVV